MDNATLVARPAVEITGASADFAISSPEPALTFVLCAPGRLSDLNGLVSSAFGCQMPQTPSLVAGDGIEFAWAGPNRWLALAEEAPEASIARLAAALSDTASSVDVSDAYAVIRMTGPGAKTALAKLLPIDLDAPAFCSSTNAVALTHIGHVGVIIIQRGSGPSFDILVPRSFAVSMAEWIC